ncbi:MAG: hypothetical protein AAGF71_08945 [Pseudomonadota bacterium]
MKTALIALSLTLLPGLAMAYSCNWGSKATETAASCAQGMTWDADSRTCVPVTTS